MEVKPGYKQTEAGVIPQSWIVAELHQLCREAITYGIVQCGPHLENGVPYIRVSDMNTRELDATTMLRTSTLIAAKFARSTVEEGDLVYALRGKLGEVRLISQAVAGANLTQGTARLSPNNKTSSAYLLWAMRSPGSLRQAGLEAKGTTFREITLADLRRIRVPLPPTKAEQEAIAEALSDADALIESLEQLLVKKRQLKQGAMQELLTGKKRLPGFEIKPGYKRTELGEIPQDWDVCRLAEGIKLTSGHHVLAQHCNTDGQGVAYITGPSDFPNGIILHTKHTTRPGTTCGTHDILITVKGSGAGTLVLADASYCISRQLMAVSVLSWSTQFVFYSLLRDGSLFAAAATGLIPGLSRSDILDKGIAIPPIKTEQEAIAAILSDMDAEIAALETKLAKARQVKQGMIQKLLTGRIRLV